MMRQPWQRYYIKDTDKGPMVWEIKFAPCWVPRAGGAVGPYWLVIARNALDPNEVKYFLSNATSGVPLSAVLHVAFGRWPVERCLQDEKSELGLSRREVRCYPALKRHLLITGSQPFVSRTSNATAEGGKSEEIHTLPPVHMATNALIDALPLPEPEQEIHTIEHALNTWFIGSDAMRKRAKATRKHASKNSNGTTSTSLSFPDAILHDLPRCAVVLIDRVIRDGSYLDPGWRRSGRSWPELERASMSSVVSVVALAHDRRHLLIAVDDGTLRLCAKSTGNEICRLKQSADGVWRVVSSNAPSRIMAGSTRTENAPAVPRYAVVTQMVRHTPGSDPNLRSIFARRVEVAPFYWPRVRALAKPDLRCSRY